MYSGCIMNLTAVDVMLEVSSQTLVVVVVKMAEEVGGATWNSPIAECIHSDMSPCEVQHNHSPWQYTVLYHTWDPLVVWTTTMRMAVWSCHI